MSKSKQWKVNLTNWFLKHYTKKHGRLADKATLNSQSEFANIVIYSTTALGDFMFNTPAIRAVRERYPNAHITLVAHRKNRDLVENGLHYDRVVYWNNKIKTIFPLIRTLKEHQPDLALILHSHLPYDVISAVMSGARYIIRDNYSSGISGLEPWLTNYIFHYYGHFVRRKLELVSILGCRADNPAMELPAPYQPGVKSTEHQVVGFQIGASTASRCWPVGHFAALADKLVSQHPNLRIVLIGGHLDAGLGKSLLETVAPATRQAMDNQIGQTNLQQLLTLIDSFHLLVTGDTGPLHLAVALQVRTVSLFVTADSRSTGPIQDTHLHRILQVSRTGYTIEREAESPMGVLQPELVYQAAREQLAAEAESQVH